MKNIEIREAVAQSRVKFWEVAAALNISEGTLCRRLRKELPEEEQQRILSIIQRLKDGEAV